MTRELKHEEMNGLKNCTKKRKNGVKNRKKKRKKGQEK